jgi:hypothetical protein
MSVGTITKPSTAIATFPKATVEASLRKELLQAATAIASIHGVPMPAGAAQQSSMSIQLDSLAVVDLLCSVESIIGFKIKEHVVKAGGYGSIDEAVGELMPRLEKEWMKHQIKGGKK